MRFVVLLISWCVFSVTAINGLNENGDKSMSKETRQVRQKRSVVLLPSNTSITLTFDLSMPVAALASQLGYYNMRLPFRFFIPTYNQLTTFYGRADSREDDDNEIDQIHRHEQERAIEERRFIYKNIESLLSSFGIDGMACVQRAICELSEAPIAHNDLFGNTLSLLFTPPRVADFSRWITGHSPSKDRTRSSRSGNETCEECEIMDEPYHDEYVAAYHHGKQGLCSSQYGSACPISFFTMFDL